MNDRNSSSKSDILNNFSSAAQSKSRVSIELINNVFIVVEFGLKIKGRQGGFVIGTRHLQSEGTSIEIVVLAMLDAQQLTLRGERSLWRCCCCWCGRRCRSRRARARGRWAGHLLQNGLDFHGLVVVANAGYIAIRQWGYGYEIDLRVLFGLLRFAAVLVVFAQSERTRGYQIVHIEVVQFGRLHQQFVDRTWGRAADWADSVCAAHAVGVAAGQAGRGQGEQRQ